MLELLRKLGLPPVGSAHGDALDQMLGLVHWLMLALFVGWGAFYLYTLFRFRASSNPQASYKGSESHLLNYLGAAVVIAEVVLIVCFALPLWSARVNNFPSEQNSVVVRVVAEQFVWNIHYPGPDGKFGRTDTSLIDKPSNPLGLDKNDPAALDDITNINQLRLPVNKPAVIHLSSKDVIHSFGIPEMRVKQDAIPGMSIPLWFTPTVTSDEMKKIRNDEKFDYQIACTQLCGKGHYQMRGFLTIYEQDDFYSWLVDQEPTLSTDDDEELS